MVDNINRVNMINACGRKVSSLNTKEATGTHDPGENERVVDEGVAKDQSTGVHPSRNRDLDNPEDHMQQRDKIGQSASPTMQPGKLIEVELDQMRDGENGEWRGLEGEKDDERKESKSHNACPVTGGPPGLLDVVLWLEWRD